MPIRNYLQHGSRHRPGGTDPTPGMGVTNDWVIAQEALGSVAAGATAAPSMVGAISYQTDDGSVYAEGTATIHTVNMLQVGSYIVKATASFPPTAASNVSVSAVIGGSVTTYAYEDFAQPTHSPSDYGHVTWAQLCVVNDLSSASGAYLTFTNNTPGPLNPVVGYLHIFRLT